MSISKTCFALMMTVMPMLASASDTSMTNGCGMGAKHGSHQYDHHQQHYQHQAQDQQLDCRHHNRDGATCAQFGFGEGQTGMPWGHQSGIFVCVDRCLRYVGQAH